MDWNKLEAEEKELEARIFGEKQEDTSPPDLENEEEVEEVVEETTEEVEAHEPSKPRTSWKQRYANYKASTDNTIYTLRKDNASLKVDLEGLHQEISDMRDKMKEFQAKATEHEDPYKEVFTEDDVEVLGPEAIEVFKRALKTTNKSSQSSQEVEELREELKRIKEDRRKQAHKEAASLEEESFEKFKGNLTKMVPDWQSIDVDPKFAQFIDDADEFSGLPRKVLFQRAVQGRDTQRVALFYQDFIKTMPKSREQILASKVTPTGSQSSQASEDSSKKLYSLKEYERFMEDVIKGKYRGREKDARLLEAKYDRAFIEGRLR